MRWASSSSRASGVLIAGVHRMGAQPGHRRVRAAVCCRRHRGVRHGHITALDPIAVQRPAVRATSSPERVEMPDIDVDFEQGCREEVINHIKDVYGEDHVSQVITFGTLQAKNAVRDAARVLDYPYGTGDKITR